VWALVAGALISALSAAVESALPGHPGLWSPFHDSDFDTFGLPRASGVFAYPTIGSMYWEAAVPLLAVAPFLGDANRHGGRRGAALAVGGGALLAHAILASATRSALAGAVVACVALLWLARSSDVWVRRTNVGVLGALCLSSAFALTGMGPSALLSQRLRWWNDEEWFRVEYIVDTSPRALHAGDVFAVPVTLRNTGTIAWPRAGSHPTHLAYHWEPLVGPSTQVDFEGQRTDLPVDVPPGGVLEILATVRGPDVQGSYRLRWDLVQEEVTWFSDRGNAMPAQRVEVGPPAEGTAHRVYPFVPRATVPPPPPPRSALWRAAVVLWREHPLLGIGPDNFRRSYQAVLSPAPTGQPYEDTRLHANSLYFETLADMGLAGIAALAWIGVALARTVRRHASAADLAGIACGVAAATFFVHGALDYFLEFTPLFGLFWVLLGLSAACETESRPS
jgi:hypothetical protein